MPYADQADLSTKFLRTLIFGDPKVRKTDWACRAAEAGYNVILLDGDDGSQTVRRLPPEVMKRILVVDVKDTFNNPIFRNFFASFLNEKDFYWDEQAKIPMLLNLKNSYIHFNPMKFGDSDVIIFDSWKAFIRSVLFYYAQTKKLDLADAKKEEWDGYGFQSRFQDHVLACLHCLTCHVIVVGHAAVYEKWDRRKNLAEPVLLSRKTQIVSSSGPHAGTVMSHFTDILYFERTGPTTFTIDTAGDHDRIGGSRLIKPDKFLWEELPVSLLLEKIGAPKATKPCEGAIWYRTGEEANNVRKGITKPTPVPQPLAAPVAPIATPESAVIQMPAATPVKASGFFQKLKEGGK